MGDFLRKSAEILKVDRRLGIAYGFAIVCKEVKDGTVQDYYDLQNDNVPEDEMVAAAARFAMTARVGKVQHKGDQVADVLFVFPLSEDIAKGLKIQSERFGLLIGYKPREQALLDAIEKGEYTGFSLGGTAERVEV